MSRELWNRSERQRGEVKVVQGREGARVGGANKKKTSIYTYIENEKEKKTEKSLR